MKRPLEAIQQSMHFMMDSYHSLHFAQSRHQADCIALSFGKPIQEILVGTLTIALEIDHDTRIRMPYVGIAFVTITDKAAKPSIFLDSLSSLSCLAPRHTNSCRRYCSPTLACGYSRRIFVFLLTTPKRDLAGAYRGLFEA
jgi:hypothetical protein